MYNSVGVPKRDIPEMKLDRNYFSSIADCNITIISCQTVVIDIF